MSKGMSAEASTAAAVQAKAARAASMRVVVRSIGMLPVLVILGALIQFGGVYLTGEGRFLSWQNLSIVAQQQLSWPQVAMRDADRMGGCQTTSGHLANTGGFKRRKRAVQIDKVEGRSFEAKRHDEKKTASFLADSKAGQAIRMIEPCRQPGLQEKWIDLLASLLEHAQWHYFDGNFAIQHCV